MSCRGIIFSGKYKMHTQTTQSLPLSSLTASHNKKKTISFLPTTNRHHFSVDQNFLGPKSALPESTDHPRG